MLRKRIVKIVEINTEPIEVTEYRDVRKTKIKLLGGERLQVGDFIKHERVGKIIGITKTHDTTEVEMEIIKGSWGEVNL